MGDHVTLIQPGEGTTGGPGHGSLPADLMQQAAGRLRVLALLYAAVYFMAGIVPMLAISSDRHLFLGHPEQWVPPVVAILVALVVAWVAGSGRLSLARVMLVGLVFEVVSSYGIAISELMDTNGAMPGRMVMVHGLSWVAVWVMLFTIVVPSPPRRAVVAALASVSAVPVTELALMALNLTPLRVDPLQLFFWMILPYLLVVGMAYVGARVIYALGSEVKRARELGSYRLEEKLGQGGMGEVWRARHRLLARPAAIKLMRAGGPGNSGPPGSEDTVRRFEREAQVIASLRSQHTVNLFDFGVAEDGSFYYVMELLDGLDTDRLVRRFGPLPAGRAIRLLRQVCHSLSEAESHGLVHRDIKPANIFLCRYGEEYDFVKVLDFGIVKATEETAGAGQDGQATAEHVLNGTPAFMAPEQAMGGRVDARADIYATGCVAYWLLTGQLVFQAPTPMGYLVHHSSTAPTPPSTRSELPIPEALDALILSCLAKDPAQRPQSARELSRRLGAIDGVEEWSDEAARAWWERTRL